MLRFYVYDDVFWCIVTKIIFDDVITNIYYVTKIIVYVAKFLDDVWTKSVVTSFDVVMFILYITMSFYVGDVVDHRDKIAYRDKILKSTQAGGKDLV